MKLTLDIIKTELRRRPLTKVDDVALFISHRYSVKLSEVKKLIKEMI